MNQTIPDSQSEGAALGYPLPKVEVRPHSWQYGSCWQAARYCALPEPPSLFPGEWQHGWQPEFQNWHPEAIVGTDGLSRHRKTTSYQFVARKDQEAALRSFGYKKAMAIGHPIVYVPCPTIERLPNSLLVMPVHSIATTEHEWNFDEYAEEIEKIAGDFSQVVICVSPSCFEKGYWVNAFRKRGFPVISGASFNDRNAYDRLATLFRRFEFTTTNGYGSHLAYAQYFGSKISIYGPWPTSSRKDYANDLIYGRCPELLDFMFSRPMEDRIRESWPWLFTHPSSGIADQEWAGRQLGLDSKITPEAMLELFGWGQKSLSERFAIMQCKLSENARIIRRSLHRIIDHRLSPKGFLECCSLANAASTPAGQESILRVSGKSFHFTNGPQAVREHSTYAQGSFGQTTVNPPGAPIIDLVVNDGIALHALARRHPGRAVHVVEYPGTSFEKNRHLWPEIHTISPSKGGTQPLTCCDKVGFVRAHVNKGDCGEIFAAAGILRTALCVRCAGDFFALRESLARLSLLLIEYYEPNARNADLGLLARHMLDAGFRLTTSSITYFPPEYVKTPPGHHLTYVEAVGLGERQRSEFPFPIRDTAEC